MFFRSLSDLFFFLQAWWHLNSYKLLFVFCCHLKWLSSTNAKLILFCQKTITNRDPQSSIGRVYIIKPFQFSDGSYIKYQFMCFVYVYILYIQI